MIKLLIVDNHPVCVEGLKYLFKKSSEIKVIGTTNNGLDAITILNTKEVDIILMDINLPTLVGIKTAKQLQLNYPNVKIIVFTEYRDFMFIERRLKYNIKGCLLKSSSPSKIISVIKKVNIGKKYIDKQLMITGPKVKRDEDYSFINIPTFSNREKQVLELICGGLYNSEIGNMLGLTRYTIETYRVRIMAKSKKRNTAELVKWAVKNDLVI